MHRIFLLKIYLLCVGVRINILLFIEFSKGLILPTKDSSQPEDLKCDNIAKKEKVRFNALQNSFLNFWNVLLRIEF